MWTVAKPRAGKRRYAKHTLDAIRDAFLSGKRHLGKQLAFNDARRAR